MTDSAAGEGTGLGRRIGAGREAEVYAWGDDAVVKLYRPGYAGHRTEAAALAALDGHHIAPGLVDVVHHDGRPGLVLERVVGEDMLTLLMRQPWRVLGLARALAGAHLAIHDVRAPADLPDVRQVLAARIEAAALPRALQGFALRTLDGLPSGDRLCHGDYHPGNVMVGADRVSVIDWPNAARGVPEADHARAILLLRWADPLPGTSLVARGLTAAGRSLLASTYTRAYARDRARGSRRSTRQVEPWLVANVAARLSEGIEAERPKLIGVLTRARHEDRTR
ncbi:phosphotransferase family protein [Promicromonospora soli]